MSNVLFSHLSDDWATPKRCYDTFMSLGYFDPCPLHSTFDGLSCEWKEHNFVNPPYSKLKEWIRKAIKEYKKGKEVVLLIPARTDTQAFKMLYEVGCHFTFIVGRLKFGGSDGAAPFPSVLVTICGRNVLDWMDADVLL